MPTPTAPTTTSRTLLTLLLGLSGFLLLAQVSPAQSPVQRRLVLDIELQRHGPVQSGVDQGEQRLSQRWQLQAQLQGDGVPMVHNPLDPDEPQRQLQALQAAPRAAAIAPAPDPAVLQARAQALMARCGQDSACLMREAAALTAAVAPPTSPGRPKAHASADDAGPATPFLAFAGTGACGLQLMARLDERAQGHYNDVHGPVAFTETAQGQETRRDDLLCPALQAVLDTRTGRLWVSLGVVTPDVPAVRTRAEAQRPTRRQEGRLPLSWREAQSWLQQKLGRLTVQGQDQARFPAGSGQTEIRLSWSFRPA